jgi:outer membrane biosynthesis protein TonB
MTATLAKEKENKKKGMRISIIIHLLLLLLAFLYIMPKADPPVKPYAVQVEFTFAKSSLSNYAKSDPGKARAKTKKVEKVATSTPKPIEVKKPDIKTPEKPKKPVETKPTDPIVTEVVQEESPIEAIEDDIEVEIPEPEEIYEEELEEVPEEVFEEPVVPVPAPSESKAESGGSQVSNEDGKADGPPSALDGEDGGSGKSNTGNGSGASSGNDGDEGIGQGGTGLGDYDDSGDGVFGRRVIYRNLKGLFAAKMTTGKIVMKICINRGGTVEFAEVLESTEKNRKYLKKILEAAKGYKYEPDPTAPKEQCGKLTVDLDIQALRSGR